MNPAVTETFTVTVTDENFAPVITAPGDKTYEQGEAITAFDITVTDADGDTVTVTVTGLPDGLSYANGQVSGTVSQDADVQDYTVTISADDGTNDAVTETFTVTVIAEGTSNAPPVITAPGDKTYEQGEAITAFDITVTDADSDTVTVTVTGLPSGLSYANGQVSGTVSASAAVQANTVTISADDSVNEAVTETFTITVTAPRSPQVTIADASAREGNPLTFTVTLDKAVPGGLTVTPSFTDVTATKGADYTENTAVITFAGTQNETKTFTVATTGDAVVEQDETFTVGLTVSETSMTVTATDTATGTIINDNEGGTAAGATVTITDARAAEGEALSFTVTLNRAVPGGLTVTPRFTDGTATQDSDYTPNTAVLRFTGTSGERRSFTVETLDDKAVEGDETFRVSLDLTGAAAGLTAGSPATGTITDNDGGAVGGGRGANNAPNAEDDYITVSRGETATTLSNGNSATQIKNLSADPFAPPEGFLGDPDDLDDPDDLGGERSDLAILLETSVLANDSDLEDDISELSVELVDDVSYGDLTLNTDGTFVYAHDGSEVAEDRFTYRVKDSDGALSEIAGVTITIVEVTAGATNGGPEAEIIPDQILVLGKDGTVNLSNYFTDPDGDPLTYQARASDGSGTVRVNVSAAEVILTPVAVRVTRVTVTARDPGGLSVEQTFGVTVESIAGRNERLLEFSLAAFGRTVASQAVDAIGGRFDTSLRESAGERCRTGARLRVFI